MPCESPEHVVVEFNLTGEVLGFVFFLKPRGVRFLQVHFQNVDIRKPLIPVNPELPLTLAVDQACGCRTVCVKDNDAFAFLLEVSEGIERHFIVADRNEYEDIALHESFYVGWQDRIHKPRLAFQPVVHVDKPEADNITLIVARRDTSEVDAAIAFEYFFDIIEVDFPNMRYRKYPDGVTGKCRQRDDGMGDTSPLLDQVAVVRDDVIAGHGSDDGNLFHDSSFSCVSFSFLCIDEVGRPEYTCAVAQHRPHNGCFHPVIKNILFQRMHPHRIDRIDIPQATPDHDHMGIDNVDDHAYGLSEESREPLEGVPGHRIRPGVGNDLGHSLLRSRL